MDFEQYKRQFPYKGNAVYSTLYQLHGQNIKTKKEKFAVNNLEKIFKATFKISSKIGFHEMSLRDLCRETGLSMGGIYSSIESKDMIAIMVKDIVKHVSAEIIENSIVIEDKTDAVQQIIVGHIFASEILQPWFYFLYFETRSLPNEHQQDSKNIEINLINTIENLLKEIVPNKTQDEHRYHFVATMVLCMMQERYLKYWKYKDGGLSIDDYANEIVSLSFAALET